MTRIQELLLFFAGSLGTSFLVAWAFLRRNDKPMSLRPGAVFRLRCQEGIHRATLVEETSRGWLLGAPLQRDSYVPIRVGEKMLVEATDENGAFLFRTEVLEREVTGHRLLIARPKRLSRIERRGERRRREVALDAMLDGEEGKVVDLSRFGARIATRASLTRGERVRLDVDGASGPMYGWVLEAMPGSDLGYNSSEVRVRFE